jgi:hypothetical protein
MVHVQPLVEVITISQKNLRLANMLHAHHQRVSKNPMVHVSIELHAMELEPFLMVGILMLPIEESARRCL